MGEPYKELPVSTHVCWSVFFPTVFVARQVGNHAKQRGQNPQGLSSATKAEDPAWAMFRRRLRQDPPGGHRVVAGIQILFETQFMFENLIYNDTLGFEMT